MTTPEKTSTSGVRNAETDQNEVDAKWRSLLGRGKPIDSTIKPILLKTIRDPVHKDIRLTPFEISIIDTEEFQRLRHHRQLGPCYLVYPGAEHTRFQHALGTLYVAQRIISAINNPITPSNGTKKTVRPREIVLTRLVALLHDVVNIPFGHTLEDEGNLVERDWKDTRRVDEILGEEKPIGKMTVTYINEAIGPGEGSKFLKELREILLANDEKDIQQLPHPFISDIVSNTICADLLDYLRRDTYFTGIQKNYDWRIVKYFVLVSYKSCDRLAILLWTGKHRMKRDILSELVGLLQMRYSLAEMVYYHHAKLAASAMVIRAVDDSDVLKTSFPKLLKYGDDQLLSILKDGSKESAKTILLCYDSRRLYKPIYQLSYAKRSAGSIVPDQISKAAGHYYESRNSRDLETKLESLRGFQRIGLTKGHVIVYCPNPKMNMKVATTKVVWQDENVYDLKDVPDEDLREEVRSIEEKHRKLWKLMVFVHPDSYNQALLKGFLSYLAQKCEEAIGVPNELPFHMSELERRVLEGEDVTLRLDALNQVLDYSSRKPTEGITIDETLDLVRSIAQRGEREGKYVQQEDSQMHELLENIRKRSGQTSLDRSGS